MIGIGGVQIANEVLAAFKRGVRVRIITDDGQAKGVGSDIQKFADAVSEYVVKEEVSEIDCVSDRESQSEMTAAARICTTRLTMWM